MYYLGYDIRDYSEEEIKGLINTKVDFAALFFVMNRPNAFYEAALDKGYSGPHPNNDPEALTNWLLDLMDRSPRKAAAIFSRIPYDPNTNNWTGNFTKEGIAEYDLSSEAPEETPLYETSDDGGDDSNSTDWGSIGSGVGAIGDTLCQFVDSCQSRPQYGQGGQVGRRRRGGMSTTTTVLLVLGGIVGVGLLIYALK